MIVPHHGLLEKLETLGLDNFLSKWLCDYYTGRTQQVVVALLVLWCTTRISIDDILLYRQITCEQDFQLLQADIFKNEQRTKQWHLTLNPNKCKYFQEESFHMPSNITYYWYAGKGGNIQLPWCTHCHRPLLDHSYRQHLCQNEATCGYLLYLNNRAEKKLKLKVKLRALYRFSHHQSFLPDSIFALCSSMV